MNISTQKLISQFKLSTKKPKSTPIYLKLNRHHIKIRIAELNEKSLNSYINNLIITDLKNSKFLNQKDYETI